MRRLVAAVSVSLALVACSAAPPIDTRYSAQSQGSRVQFIILHFTWDDWENSLRILTQGPVSSHYLVRDEPVRIYRLVAESQRAFHAGESAWKGHGSLNAASIGIEIVNAGNRLADQGIDWQPYPEAQIDAVIELVRWIAERHGVPPENILGHSDIAPQRKVDPGPRFPWHRLAEAGLIPWPDEGAVLARRAEFERALPDVAWFQARLAVHGYQVPRHGRLDEETRRVISAFQMRFRQSRYDGAPDAETAAILAVLTDADGASVEVTETIT
ncbi:MAG: N-acetylmuramoyl-L-alanine amidase [Gammaproteobacteria bacterium]|nr:N-acetylmuramoyl-L-alanine amidase [Gammaproteobacteria bacterium]TVQ48351.1 MAG: N-acetylmuramoyl-L-alanine amidase [Gammaproteobacteria bacterium]